MLGLDHLIAGLGREGSRAAVFAVAVLLGLRHPAGVLIGIAIMSLAVRLLLRWRHAAGAAPARTVSAMYRIPFLRAGAG